MRLFRPLSGRCARGPCEQRLDPNAELGLQEDQPLHGHRNVLLRLSRPNLLRFRAEGTKLHRGHGMLFCIGCPRLLCHRAEKGPMHGSPEHGSQHHG